MQAWVIQVMNSFGYIGIFLLILIENLFPPIPSEVILTFGGFMTTYTNMNVTGVIAASTAGSVIGAIILYYGGKMIPRQKLEKLLDGKAGTWLHFDKQDVEDAVTWFDKKGKTAVLICRCVPIIRSLISIPAGMAQMNFFNFVTLTTLGSLVWNTVLVCAGAFTGESWGKVLDIMGTYSEITVLVIGAVTFGACSIFFRKKDG